VENSNLAANIEIYDAHSDNYCAHTRQDPQIAQRIRHAVIRLLNDESCGRVSSAKYHLDFGCGPGHVLEWLSDLNFLQVGLDVSLRNLRNVRRNTKALVVCGDAANMPFADKTFHLVTESSALHHIEDWTSVVLESCRVCSQYGGILLDSEPTKEQKAWGPLARAVFEARFPVYKVLSYAFKSKYMFRNIEQAKLNMLAEVHNRPGTGFLLEELHNLFDQAGFEADIIVSPTPNLESKANPNWQYVVLNLLSGRNPWNPKYGSFTALARPRSVDCSSLGSNL
jgi:SAM-dependent methyltransferase